jgi:hypothetical protein
MGQVIDVVPLAVVGAEEGFDVPPCGLDGVCVSARTLINEAYSMVDGTVCVTVRVEIAVRSPVITDDDRAGFDPVTNTTHQGVSCSVRNGNEKRFPGVALDTAKEPLPFNWVVPMVFAPTELALVDFDGFVRIADLLRAALEIHQHSFSPQLALVCGGTGAKAMFSFGNVGRYAAHDVACEEHNLLESEFTLLKP